MNLFFYLTCILVINSSKKSKVMNGIFGGFKSEKPSFTQLPEGKQLIKLVAAILLNSFLNHDGTEKPADKRKGWMDSTPQLAITVIGVDNKGGMTHRLNGLGYKTYDSLTEKQLKSGKFENIEGYACQIVDGNLVRIVDDAKTEQCKNILNELFSALGLEEGSGVEELKAAAAVQTPFIATVVKDIYQDKENYKLTKYRKVRAAVSADFEG